MTQLLNSTTLVISDTPPIHYEKTVSGGMEFVQYFETANFMSVTQGTSSEILLNFYKNIEESFQEMTDVLKSRNNPVWRK